MSLPQLKAQGYVLLKVFVTPIYKGSVAFGQIALDGIRGYVYRISNIADVEDRTMKDPMDQHDGGTAYRNSCFCRMIRSLPGGSGSW